MLTKQLIFTPSYPSTSTTASATTTTTNAAAAVSSPSQRFRAYLTTTFHTAGLLFSLLSASLFSAAIPRWNANFFHNTGPSRGDWTDGMPLGPLVFALLYHAGTLLYHSRIGNPRRPSNTPQNTNTHKTLTPRRTLLLNTTISTLVILTLLPSLVLAGYGSLFRFWRPAMRSTQSGSIPCNTMLNVFSRQCQPVLYSVGNLQLAGIVFGCMVWICHFALLLMSLRNLRRHSLVKKVQNEKWTRFTTTSSSSSSSSTRSASAGSRSAPSRTMSMGAYYTHGNRRGPGSRKASASREGSGERRTGTNRPATRSGDQVQMPLESRPPVLQRYA
ncbi:hypothetical protein LTS15_006877 [Exophiala xenobiotica]|nr:hypothetical protein LTS15_006877 [Exophiala xenobiotica]